MILIRFVTPITALLLTACLGSAPSIVTATPAVTLAATFIQTAHRPTNTVLPLTETAGLTFTVSPLPTLAAPSVLTATTPPTETIVVDHTSIALFKSIPDNYIEKAAAIPMLYIDRSVGSNISDALTCLEYTSEEVAPNHCTRRTHKDPAFSTELSEVSWSRPGGYDRTNWVFQPWAGSGCGLWHEEVGCFFEMVAPVLGDYEVLSYQFSYAEVMPGSNIADQPGGFFSNNPDRLDVYDMEAFEAQHPDKTFIYWTTSLARSIGSPESESFNNQMRQYALKNNKILFDVADILSHDPEGNPCYDNRDGVPYDNGNKSENYPDDGVNLPAICQHYTTEIDGGHLGSVSSGKIRAAKAFWVLMAQIAGWKP